MVDASKSIAITELNRHGTCCCGPDRGLPPPETALPAYEDWQDRENQRNPKGLISRLWRWVKR